MRVRFGIIATLAAACACTAVLSADEQRQYKRYEQDPSRNNLVHADGYATIELGTLGHVARSGRGGRPMILIAGAGFGAADYEEFVAAYDDDFTTYTVTLPGFGGTQAPPMPDEGTSYADLTWTNSVVTGVRAFIENEGLEEVALVAHWYLAPQIAMQLAIEDPERIGSLIIIAGIGEYSLGQVPVGTPMEARGRAAGSVAESWFRSVTRETWDDNNFLPGDYATHPVRAIQLWRTAADAPLPVWIRYMCEAWATDTSKQAGQLEVPTLIVIPEFDDAFEHVRVGDYMEGFCHRSWDWLDTTRNAHIRTERIEVSRVFVMDDQPEALHKKLRAYLGIETSSGSE